MAAQSIGGGLGDGDGGGGDGDGGGDGFGGDGGGGDGGGGSGGGKHSRRRPHGGTTMPENPDKPPSPRRVVSSQPQSGG